jgi:hypothetical protein
MLARGESHGARSAWLAMKASNILRERSLPRDRHRDEQRVESSIVESLAKIATNRQDETFFAVGSA